MISFFIIWSNRLFSACIIDPDKAFDITTSITNCMSTANVVNPSGDISLTWNWFKDVILWWVRSLSIFLSAWAVFWIVYWSLLLTLSWWEDEKIKKWKDLIKWSIIWFLGVVFASVIISIVINFIYSLS